MIYYYRTRFGTFWIKPQPGVRGRWLLGIDAEALGSYASPNMAAGDVFSHATGHFEWDCLAGELLDVPETVAEWNRGRPDV